MPATPGAQAPLRGVETDGTAARRLERPAGGPVVSEAG